MAFVEAAEYDPLEIEKYVVSHKDFFKRWTLQNITLNQLNAILLEQQLMPSSAAADVPEDSGEEEEEADDTSATALTEIGLPKKVNDGCTTL